MAAALAALLVLGACGGGSDDDEAAPTTTSTTAATSTTTSTSTTTTAPPTTTTVPPSKDPQPYGPLDTTPDRLAADLRRVEGELRAGGAGDGRLQQRLYRTLVAHPDWIPGVVAAMPPELRAAVQANADAGIELRALNRTRTTLPNWRIVPPAPVEELLRYYREAEAAKGVPWQYLAAIHLVETRMGRIRGTSSAGAQGPMQFLPATWAAYGEGDINNTRDAILGAANYLRANGAPGNMQNALFRYNHSQRYVNAVSAYARVMQQDERAFRGYHGWQVVYALATGDVLLPEGYGT